MDQSTAVHNTFWRRIPPKLMAVVVTVITLGIVSGLIVAMVVFLGGDDNPKPLMVEDAAGLQYVRPPNTKPADVVSGRNLTLRVWNPILVDSITYRDEERMFRSIERSRPDRKIAAIWIALVNRNTTIVPLLVDLDIAELGESQRYEVVPLDPFETAETVDFGTTPPPPLYQPFIWGTIDLAQGYEVQGWMFFEVPDSLKLKRLEWHKPESLTAEFAGFD